jgi:hypothetical protein
MASFLDQPQQFSPYIQQFDPQAYASVGMFRQNQYDQGVARVQNYIDTVAGIKVARDVDKQYLNSRVGEITSRLNSLVGADYSSQSLIGQVGGLAYQVASDPIIQNAEAGAAAVSKIRADIEAAKKDGKSWSAANEYVAMKSVQEWYNDPNPGAEFRGQGYSPYIDINTRINERWKQAHPDSILRQSTNGDYYAYVMTETGYKVLAPDQVRAGIEATLDPNEINQLNINAEYNYRNFTPDNLKAEANSIYGERQEGYQNYIKKLEFDKLDNANNPQVLKELEDTIATYKDKIKSAERNKQDILSAAETNPAAAKAYLYRNKWLDGMAGMIGYTESSQKIVDNPLRKRAWDEYMDWNKFQQDQQKLQLEKDKLAFDVANGGKKSKSKTEGDSDNLGDLGLNAPLNNPTALTIEQFNQKAIDMHDRANNDLLELIWRKNPELFKDPQYTPNTDGTLRVKYVPKDKNTLIQIQAKAKQWGTMYGEGSDQLDPMVKTWFDTHYTQLQLSDKMKDVSKKLNADADRYIRTQSEYAPKLDELEKSKKFFNTASSFLASSRNGGIQITQSDLRNYAEMISNERAAAPVTGGSSMAPATNYEPYSESQYSKYNLTKDKFNAIVQNAPDKYRSAAQKIIKLSGEVKNVLEEKQRYINEQLRPFQFLQSNTEIQIPTNEPKLARSWAGVIGRIHNQRTQGGSTLGGSTNWDVVNKMMTGKNINNLQIFYVQPTVGGNPQLLLTNPDVNNGKQEKIELDIPTAISLGLYKNDQLEVDRAMLALNQGRTTGKRKFGQVGKYNVQYEVSPYLNSFIPTLYVSIPGQSPQQVSVTEGTFNSLDAVIEFLRGPQIESYLDTKLGVNSQFMNSSGMNSSIANPFMSSNPFFQQLQAAGLGQNQ